MGVENLVSFSKLLEGQKLRETLQQDFTNIERYECDYKNFKIYCTQMGQSVSGEMLVYYLHHSLKVESVKKNTFNRRYFACKKMMELEGIHLTDEQISMVKKLRKHYKSDEHAAQAVIQGKRAIPSDDLLSTINAMDDLRTKAILLVQFYTGCRPSEMVLLKISDFDLDNSYVNVYLKKQKVYAEKRLKLNCVNAIKAYIRSFNLTSDSYFIGAVDKHGHYHSRQISLTGYNKFLHRTIGLSSYVFRKSLVSHMHNNGAGVETIQKQTGHSNTKTIQEHYLNVDKTMVDKFL